MEQHFRGSLSLLHFDPGQYERSVGKFPTAKAFAPAATADTTAELGCICSQLAGNCVCRLIRPVTDQGSLRFLCRRGRTVTVAHRPGACHLPGRFSRRTVQTAFTPYFYDRQRYFQQPTVAGKHHSPSKINVKRHGKRQHLAGATKLFVSCFIPVIQFSPCLKQHSLMIFPCCFRTEKGALAPCPSPFLPNSLRPEYCFSISNRTFAV